MVTSPRNFCILFCLIIWFAGCGNETDRGKDLQDAGPDTSVDLTGDTSDTGVLQESLAGRTWLVTKMNALQPTSALDPMWAQDIAQNELILLVSVHTHDPDSGAATMSITSAVATLDPVSGEVTEYHNALEPVPFDAIVDREGFTIQGPIEVDILTPTVSKPFHVEQIQGYGRFSKDLGILDYGYLEGSVTTLEAGGMCMFIPGLGNINFQWLLNMARLCPDVDSDGDNQPDSYLFIGEYQGEATTRLRDELQPVTPQIPDCPMIEEDCGNR